MYEHSYLTDVVFLQLCNSIVRGSVSRVLHPPNFTLTYTNEVESLLVKLLLVNVG
jgi:hypothetical protein